MPREEKCYFNSFELSPPPRNIAFTYKTYVMQIVWGGISNYISVLFLQEITNDLQKNAKGKWNKIQPYRTVFNDVTCRWWNNNFYYLTDSRSQIMSDYYRLFTQVTERHSFLYIMLTSSMYSACALRASQFDASLQLMYNFRKCWFLALCW